MMWPMSKPLTLTAKLLAIVMAGFVLSSPEARATQADAQVSAKLRCSALSINPKIWPSYSQDITIQIFGRQLSGVRMGHRLEAREDYAGSISGTNDIELQGRGRNKAGHTWTSTFAGRISSSGSSLLAGVQKSKGVRKCTLEIAKLSDELLQQLGLLANSQSASLGRSDRRVALVIGNSSYASVGTLPNPKRDAEAVAKSLQDVGFDAVVVKENASRNEMLAALNSFQDLASNAEWAVVYFSGHGLEVGGTNYVVPVDAKLLADRDVGDEGVSLERLLVATAGARKLRLVILDACRDDPFVSKMQRTIATRSIGRGLARVEPEGGTLVVFAAKDGQLAYDGDGQSSPFVAALTKWIGQPNIEIGKLFRLVRDDVWIATGKKQEPFVYGSLPGDDFFFLRK
jgi:Caspase domain